MAGQAIAPSEYWISLAPCEKTINIKQTEKSAAWTKVQVIGVAAVGFLAVTVYRSNQVAPFSTVELTAIAVTAVLFLGTIATGGLLSIGKEMPEAFLRLHQITPYLTVLSTVWLLWSVLPAQESLIS